MGQVAALRQVFPADAAAPTLVGQVPVGGQHPEVHAVVLLCQDRAFRRSQIHQDLAAVAVEQQLLHLHCPAVLVGVGLIYLNYAVGDQSQVLLSDSKVVHQPLVQPRSHCKGGSHHQGGGNKGHKAPLHSSLHGLLLSFRSVQSVQHGHLLLLSRGDLIKHPAQVKVIHGIPPPELLSVFFVPGPARCGQ